MDHGNCSRSCAINYVYLSSGRAKIQVTFPPGGGGSRDFSTGQSTIHHDTDKRTALNSIKSVS